MEHQDVADLMSDLFADEASAVAVLRRIGFPAESLPSFRGSATFWASTLSALERGAAGEDALPRLIAEAARAFPGSSDAQALQARWSRLAKATTEPAASAGFWHTLTLTGADLADEFVATVREQFADSVSGVAELLYVSAQLCAVAIPDPGSHAAQLQRQVQELMQRHAPAGAPLQVIYEKYPHRPYLLNNLTVFGPDTTPYLLQSVPSTVTPRDIAAAIVAEPRGLDVGRTPIEITVDVEITAGSSRLDPDKTLHDNRIQDHGQLRVSTPAAAGGGVLPPERPPDFAAAPADPIERLIARITQLEQKIERLTSRRHEREQEILARLDANRVSIADLRAAVAELARRGGVGDTGPQRDEGIDVGRAGRGETSAKLRDLREDDDPSVPAARRLAMTSSRNRAVHSEIEQVADEYGLVAVALGDIADTAGAARPLTSADTIVVVLEVNPTPEQRSEWV